MSKHWHVDSGFSGYGPDASDNSFTLAFTPEELADAVRAELGIWADYEFETAHSYAENGDYKAAWEMRNHSDTIETLCMNLDNDRANTPLYVGNRKAWHETILRTIEDEFPYLVNERRSKVYVWECTETECSNEE